MNTGGGGGGGSSGSALMTARSPFTLSQWQELEHQALIFKYMIAGLPVPPELLLPIQKSFESISPRFFHHPTMGYCSYYGKKLDPEPGRCRRTDGKKWRCSKDAYPDSKYCERHMHRGRNRSRKPVESHNIVQSVSTAASLTVAGSSSGNGSFQNVPLHNFGNPQGTGSGSNPSQYQLESIPYGIPSKDYRYLQGLKTEVGDHTLYSEASASNKGPESVSALNTAWPLMPSSFPSSRLSSSSVLQNEYSPQTLFSGEFASEEPVKQEGHLLRPFFNEWPNRRDSWSGLDDEKSNQTSFSTTQLSISIPMTSSDFSVPSTQSEHGEFRL